MAIKYILVILIFNVFICHEEKITPSLNKYVIHRGNQNYPEIIRADSLAFYVSKKDGLNAFKSLHSKFSAQEPIHYINNRITSLEAQLELVPDTFAIENRNKSQSKDPFDALAYHDLLYFLKPKLIDINDLKGLLQEELEFLPRVLLLNRIGQYYKEVNYNLDSSWLYYITARDTLEKIGLITQEHIHTYEKLLVLSTFERKNLDAILYGNELCNFAKYSKDPDSLDKARAYINRAFVLFREGDGKGSKLDNSLALALIDTAKNIKEYQDILRNEIMFSWNFEDDTNFYEHKAKALRSIKSTGKDFININRLIGNYLMVFKKYNEAFPYLMAGYEMELSQKYRNIQIYGLLCNRLAEYYRYKNKYSKSLDFLLKMSRVDGITVDNYYEYLENSEHLNFTFFTILELAQLFLHKYAFTKDLNDLYESARLIELENIQFYNQIKSTSEHVILQFYKESAFAFFNTGMKVYYLLYMETNKAEYLYKFIQISDKSKNSLLYRDALIKENNSLISAEAIGKDTILMVNLKNQIQKGYRSNSDFNRFLRSYNDQLRHTEALQLKGQSEIFKEMTNVVKAQNTLSDTTSILFISQIDSFLIFNIINKNSKEIIPPILFNFLKDTLTTHQKIYFNEIEKKLNKNVIIIPEGIFLEKPVERFFSSPRNITYAPALKFITKNKINIPDGKTIIFSFSDQETILDSRRNYLTELPGGYYEALNKKKQCDNCQILSGKNATKANFLKFYTDTGVTEIHFISHSVVNSSIKDDVKMFFRKSNGGLDSLYGYELLQFNSTVPRVILSSCESAVGKYIPGEGNYSLIRYFMINGAKEIHSSVARLEDNSVSASSLIRYNLN